MTLDDIRAVRPHLGFALYAYAPGGPVTLEVHTPADGVFTFTAATEAAAIERAFPDVSQTPPSDEPIASLSKIDSLSPDSGNNTRRGEVGGVAETLGTSVSEVSGVFA